MYFCCNLHAPCGQAQQHVFANDLWIRTDQSLSSLRQDSRFDTLDLKTQEMCTALFENRSIFADDLKDHTTELAQLLTDQHNATRRTILSASRAQRYKTYWTAMED